MREWIERVTGSELTLLGRVISLVTGVVLFVLPVILIGVDTLEATGIGGYILLFVLMCIGWGGTLVLLYICIGIIVGIVDIFKWLFTGTVFDIGDIDSDTGDISAILFTIITFPIYIIGGDWYLK